MGPIAELPEGPVTIMFTDVEGSTQLRTTSGDAEANALLRQHDELVRSRITAHQGHDQEAALGDGFLAVFVSTRRALACAIDIQSELDAFNRMRSGPPLRVRIGLNTGEVASQNGQLSGEAVHAAARVCSAAAGGQILVSDVTRQLAGTVADVTFRDAGEYELKGFPHPWRLYEVVWVRETTAMPEQVFVGREKELAQLRGRLDGALDGHGGLVLVGGEPGVGKTTLVKHLIREAEKRGAFAVFGRCYESEGSIPYSPFVEMLEQALALMPPDLVREDLGDDAPEVARMVPELRRRFVDISEPLDLPPEQQRRYFFNAVASFITRASARFPLVLVIDDIHWADEPTLLLTEHMASHMRDQRVLGVGTYRDVELEVSRPLVATIERLLRARLLERVPVRRFDRNTVSDMIEALARTPPPDVVVDAIFTETEGNPFFVEEVFRHLAEEGKLLTDGEFRSEIEVDELDVPESVRLVVGRRLERLGADAQRVLAVGAVVGRAFPFRLLEASTDVAPVELLDIVEAAEDARVIVAEERDGDVHYSFGHELIRQTLLSGLSALRRQRIHLAVADAMERVDPSARDDRPSEIANHLVQAGVAADKERTLSYLHLAMRRALDAAAFEDAIRLVDDAVALVDRNDAVRRAKLREQQGWALSALGRFNECITTWNDVISVYADAGLAEEAAWLCGEVAIHQAWLSRFQESFAAYARGVSIIGDRPSPVRARLLSGSAGMLGLAGAYDLADEQLIEAEALARENDDDRALGRVLWARTIADWSNTLLPGGIAAGRSAIDRFRRTNEQWSLVDALVWATFPLLWSGELGNREEAVSLATEALGLARRIGHRGGEVLALRTLNANEILVGGDVAVLAEAAQRDLDGFKSIGSPWASQSHVMLADAALLRGDLETAKRQVRDAAALEPASAWTGMAWSSDFIIRGWSGDIDGCRRLLSEQLSNFPTAGQPVGIGRMFMAFGAAQGCVVAGLLDEAASLYPLVADLAAQLPLVGLEMMVADRLAGMAAAAGAHWDDAERHFEDALRLCDDLPNRFDRPQVEHWYGEMLLDRGLADDSGRARVLLESALTAYDAQGMPLHAARVRERLTAG